MAGGEVERGKMKQDFKILDDFCNFIEDLKNYRNDLIYPQYAIPDKVQNDYCFNNNIPHYAYMHKISFYEKLIIETNKVINNFNDYDKELSIRDEIIKQQEETIKRLTQNINKIKGIIND